MKAPEKPMRVCEFLDLRGVVEQPDREAYGKLLRAELKRRKAKCTREVRGGRKVRLFEPLALMKANVHVRRVWGRVSGRALPGGMERPCPDDELPEVQFPGIRMPKGKCVPDGVRERFQARRRARKEAGVDFSKETVVRLNLTREGKDAVKEMARVYLEQAAAAKADPKTPQVLKGAISMIEDKARKILIYLDMEGDAK